MRYAKVLAVIAAGLSIGMVARSAYQSAHRVESMIAHFDRVCRSAYDGDFVSDAAREAFECTGEPEMIWDGASKTFAEVQHSRCAVFEGENLLGDEDRAQFELAAADYLAEAFPQLTFDPNAELGYFDLFKFWAQYDVNDPRRWGISLSRIQHPTDLTAIVENWSLVRTEIEIVIPH
jgi:hypothetical protein